MELFFVVIENDNKKVHADILEKSENLCTKKSLYSIICVRDDFVFMEDGIMGFLKSIFGKGDKKEKVEDVFVSPVNGEILDISKVPDEAFSKKMMGEGFAASSNDGDIFSPVAGEVAMIFPTKHAIIVKSEGELEVLIHMGIDTVKLDGDGFDVFVSVGDSVKAGDKLAHMDLEKFEAAGYSTITPIIATNLDEGKTFSVEEGSSQAGEVGKISIV